MYVRFPVETVAVLAKEDPAAREWLVAQYYNLIRSVAKPYFIAGGTDEDVVQEASIGFLKAIDKYKPGYNFIKFAKIVMRRQIYEAIRHANRDKYKPLNEAVVIDSQDIDYYCEPVESPLDVTVTLEDQKRFNKELKILLSELEYQVALCMIEGMGLSAIHKRLQRSYRSVDNAIQRVKRKMERWYEVV